VLVEAAGIQASSRYAWPATHADYELDPFLSRSIGFRLSVLASAEIRSEPFSRSLSGARMRNHHHFGERRRDRGRECGGQPRVLLAGRRDVQLHLNPGDQLCAIKSRASDAVRAIG
jgi:hypothetical protein